MEINKIGDLERYCITVQCKSHSEYGYISRKVTMQKDNKGKFVRFDDVIKLINNITANK